MWNQIVQHIKSISSMPYSFYGKYDATIHP
jgi:hypothetical protein